MRGSKASSFFSACARVASSIHESFASRCLERRAQVRDQRVHLRLGLGRKMLAHVDLAEPFADGCVDQSEAALPAIAPLLYSAQRLRVEFELCLVERLRQVGRIRIDEVESHVRLPGGERLAVEELCAVANRRRLVHDEILLVAETDAGEDDLPVDVRHELLQAREVHRIVDLADLALTLRRPGNGRDLVLDADHLFGASRPDPCGRPARRPS